MLIAHGVKRDAPRRVVEPARRLVEGTPARVETLRRRSHEGEGGVKTAAIERLNATWRERLAPRARRGRALARHTLTLAHARYLVGTVYKFCTSHARLRLAPQATGRPALNRTPAMAAGITDHGWTVRARLACHVPPPRWTPPKRRGRPSHIVQRLLARWCSCPRFSAELPINETWTQKLPYILMMVRHERWFTSFCADGGLMEFPNIVLDGGKAMPYTDIATQLQASAVTWDDIPWLREAWHGPIVIKGVHSLEDAERAIACGADMRALVISNHGGRQLDQVSSTLEVLHAVAPALQGANVEILMDGGIRSGLDVLMALATGAKAVLIGRAYAYGLGAGGEAGVTKAFEILRGEIAHNMRLLGCQSITELNASYVAKYPF